MDNKQLLAGMTGLAALGDNFKAPVDLFPRSGWWEPSRPNKQTAKVKRKRRIRNKIAKESRRKNRGK